MCAIKPFLRVREPDYLSLSVDLNPFALNIPKYQIVNLENWLHFLLCNPDYMGYKLY